MVYMSECHSNQSQPTVLRCQPTHGNKYSFCLEWAEIFASIEYNYQLYKVIDIVYHLVFICITDWYIG
jgi:hypothetical protein